MKHLTLIDKAFILKGTTLFAELELDLLLPIADKLVEIKHANNDIVFNVGEEAHRIYFLVKGSVQSRDRQGHILATLSPYDFFGDEALFSDQPRAYQALCQSDTVLLALSHTNLLTIISECPTVAIGLLQAFASTTPFRKRTKVEG